jgi:hypothetical protein
LHRSTRTACPLALPVATPTLALAEPLIVTLYGRTWEVVIPVLEILGVYGAVFVVVSTQRPTRRQIRDWYDLWSLRGAAATRSCGTAPAGPLHLAEHQPARLRITAGGAAEDRRLLAEALAVAFG